MSGKPRPRCALASSAGFGHTVGKTIVFGYLDKSLWDRDGFEIEVFGDRHPIAKVEGPLYDAENKKLKA